MTKIVISSRKLPIELSTFGSDSNSCVLDLVRVKAQFGKRRIPIKLLVHDQASMELNCPGLHNVAKTMKSQGHQLADRFIPSDALTGIEILIGVDYFSCFVSRLKREQV